jgi:hypothetical protein
LRSLGMVPPSSLTLSSPLFLSSTFLEKYNELVLTSARQVVLFHREVNAAHSRGPAMSTTFTATETFDLDLLRELIHDDYLPELDSKWPALSDWMKSRSEPSLVSPVGRNFSSPPVSNPVSHSGVSQMSNLMLHSGGKVATLDEVRNVPTPAAVGRWHPTSHATVLDSVRETLTGAGYIVRAEKYALARNDQRFFGILDLATPLVLGVSLSVGVRNSTDKSFPLGFAAGSRVFVCDNLAFSAELMVRRKHTVNGLRAFGAAIGQAVASLGSFKDAEAGRIRRLSEMEVSPAAASHFILTAYRRGIINSHQIDPVVQEWETPRHQDFMPRTAWSLFNAFTEVIRNRAISSPQTFVASTIRLNGLMLPAAMEQQSIPILAA